MKKVRNLAATEAREAVGEYEAGWHDPENATVRFDFGLSEQVVRDISVQIPSILTAGT